MIPRLSNRFSKEIRVRTGELSIKCLKGTCVGHYQRAVEELLPNENIKIKPTSSGNMIFVLSIPENKKVDVITLHQLARQFATMN